MRVMQESVGFGMEGNHSGHHDAVLRHGVEGPCCPRKTAEHRKMSCNVGDKNVFRGRGEKIDHVAR